MTVVEKRLAFSNDLLMEGKKSLISHQLSAWQCIDNVRYILYAYLMSIANGDVTESSVSNTHIREQVD